MLGRCPHTAHARIVAARGTWALAIVRAALVVSLLASVAAAHEPGETNPPPRTAPQLLERVAPVYPEAARQQGIGAVVPLELTVAPDGTVSDVKVTKDPGFGFAEAAAAAARQFTFKPATEDGKPVASVVLFDQGFAIQPRLAAETTAYGEESPAGTAAPPPAAQLTDKDGKHSYKSTVIDRGPISAASSTTVRNLDFDLRPKTSPNDLLRVVPGLLAVQHQGGGKADQLFLRGFDADHGTDVGVFVDGVPVNMPSHGHGQGFADLHWIIPEAIDRIEVVKHPYDPRFGDFSTAGAVNLITRNAFPESSVGLTLGSFPTEGCKHLQANFTGSGSDCPALATERFVGIAAPRFDASTWAGKLHPWFALEAAHDDGPFVNPERLRRYNLFAKLSYDVSPTTSMGVFFQAYGSEWVGSGQIPERQVLAGRLSQFGAVDPSEGGLTQRQMLTAFVHHKDESDELNATVYVTRYRLSLWDDFTFFLRDPVHGDAIEQEDTRTFAGLRVDWHFHRLWHGVSFRTTMGAEARYDGIHVDRWDAESCGVNGASAAECPNGDFRKRVGRRVDGSDLAFNGSNDDITQLNVAGFLQEDVVFNRFVRAVVALRADYFGFNVSDASEQLGQGQPNTSGVAQKALLSPKATLVGAPVPGVLEVYLNFGQGFHTNQAQIALLDGRERSIANGDGTTSSFTVHAVPKFYGGEVGARAHLWNRLDVAAALWMSYLENETVFDADASAFVPSDATRRLGFDLELRARIVDWLYADFDLAQARATAVPDSGNGGAVALAPRLYMTGGLTAKKAFGDHGSLRAGLRFRYLGPRPAFDETSPEYQYFTSRTLADGRPNPDYDPSRVEAEGYTIVDAYVGWRWRWLEAAVGAQNLLNATWREAQFGNRSCTRDETFNPANASYAGSGNTLADGSFANRCGIAYGAQRSGAVDVHYTPGVPLQLQLTVKAYF